MTYRQHPSAVSAPSTLARVRAEGMRRGLYSPVAPPPPPPAALLSPCPTSAGAIPATPALAEQQWAYDAKLRAEFGNDKRRWLAFCRAAVAGRARIAKQATVPGAR